MKAISALGCLFLSGWTCKAIVGKKERKKSSSLFRKKREKGKCRFLIAIEPVKHTQFMVPLANGIHPCIFFHLWEPNMEKLYIIISNLCMVFFNKKRKVKELTPRMQYQSTKVGFERSVWWTQSTERVDMEQISNTNLVLESDSCPILPIWEWYDCANIGSEGQNANWGLQIVKVVSFSWFWEGQ